MSQVEPQVESAPAGASPHRQILSLEEVPCCAASDGEILRLVNDDECELEALAAAIATNPGLTANVVGLANTAFFSPPHQVFTVQDAIVSVLGLRTVRSLVSSLLVSGSVDTARCSSFSLERYWQRSLATARCTQLLAGALGGRINADAAWLSGLLHELGLLVLVHVYGPAMNAVFDLHALPGNARSIVDLEEQLLEFTHPEAGRLMALRWNLPEQVGVVAGEWRNAGYRGDHWLYARTVGLAVAYVDSLERDVCPGADLLAGAADLGLGEDALLDGLGAFNSQFAQVRDLARDLAGHG